MPRKWTHRDCFAFFDTKPRDPQWSWSGRGDDGSVAVTLWQDKFLEKGRVYRSWDTDMPGQWRSRPGFVELIDNLAYVREHAAGVVHVIVAIAEDRDAVPRRIKECFPHETLKMRVAELDVGEGTSKLERIDA